MKIVLLDGDRIQNARDLHAAFADALEFPAWYGANLDALYDMLTTQTGPTGVIAVNVSTLRRNLGRRYSALMRLLEDVRSQREDFELCVDPFGEDRKEKE